MINEENESILASSEVEFNEFGLSDGYSIQDHESYMTVYYRKANGSIKGIIDGIQDMSVYGEEESDYELIWDYIVVFKDEQVKKNTDQFHVDVEAKELVYTPLIDLSKYKINR